MASLRCVKCGFSTPGLQTLGCPNNHVGHPTCITPVNGVRRCTTCLCSLADCPVKKSVIGSAPRARLRCGCVYHEDCKRTLVDKCERCGENIRAQSAELLSVVAPTRQRATQPDAAASSAESHDPFIEKLRQRAKGIKLGDNTAAVLEELERVTEIRTDQELRQVMARIGLSSKSPQNVKDIGLMLYERCVPSVQTGNVAASILTPIYTWQVVVPVLSPEAKATFIDLFTKKPSSMLLWMDKGFGFKIVDCFSRGPSSLIAFCDMCKDVPPHYLVQIGVTFPAMVQIPRLNALQDELTRLNDLCDKMPFERQLALGMNKTVCAKLIDWFEEHSLPMPETWTVEAWQNA